jgi:hypothetical protein
MIGVVWVRGVEIRRMMREGEEEEETGRRVYVALVRTLPGKDDRALS